MKLQLERTNQNTFTAYGEGYVMINNERHEANLIVLPDRVIAWEVAGFADLAERHFEAIAALSPEIVLLGTGRKLCFPHPALVGALAQARIGLEVMDLQAACRTYNILAGEMRRVAAALVFD